MKKKVLFILNPIAGITKKENIPALIEKHVDASLFETEIVYTEYAGHARKIASDAVAKSFDYVVAVGGDGTINEIGSQLVNTETVLAIVPAGSGNGLAIKLNIPRWTGQAISLLNKGEIIEIDAPRSNGNFFFSNTGMGYEGMIAHRFAETPKRGFFEYSRLMLKYYFKYREKRYRIEMDGIAKEEKLWAIEVANSGELGYGIKSVAHSDLQDELLEVFMIKAFPKWQMLFLWPIFMIGRGDLTKHVALAETKHIRIVSKDEDYVQIDGDPLQKGRILEVEMKSDRLKVLIP